MTPTLQSLFSALSRTEVPLIFDPGIDARLSFIQLELEHAKCIRDCDGPIYTNDKNLAVAGTIYKLRGRDGKAGKTTFYNDSAATIEIYEENARIAILGPNLSYSPPFAGAGELTAKSDGTNSFLRTTTQRYCDCGTAPAYIDSEPIGGFLL